ncbi:MAG: glycoside hydrolase family 13 protein [Clostridiales bacterium]|nr:glycoside hydrolase family 13 protein [Clostridiales bacterium]
MDEKPLFHNSHWSYYRHPFGAVPTGERVLLRLAVHARTKPREAQLRIWRDEQETLLPMARVAFVDDLASLHAHFEAGGTDGQGSGAGIMSAGVRDADDFYVFSGGSGSIGGTGGALDSGSELGAERETPGESSGAEGDDGFVIYQATCATDARPGLYWYYFIVKDASGAVRYYGNNMEMMGGEGAEAAAAPPSYQITVYDREFRTPAWFRHGVMYQIFPDRFFQKRTKPLTQQEIEKKRPDYILHTNWNDTPIFKPDPRTGEIMNNDFFGGNFAGIVAKLPYLASLGISILYLNPIFEAYSNHRYDTGNYRKVDALLGTNRDFASLCAHARSLGIRVILDGVFNHTGSDSLYFNKKELYKGIGAYQSTRSRYYGWYEFMQHPDRYTSWWGINTLPNVNESEPSFVEYILTGEDSVIKHWLRQGASGWRLDVVDELPDEFLVTLRDNVKAADSDAVIIGEVWEDASNKVSYGKQREYLLGHELDSVMNYVFKNALIGFMLGQRSARQFDATIRKLTENYPLQSYYALMNLVGGHDVPRILTILSEPPGDLTRDQKAIHKPTRKKHLLGLRRLRLMALVQMTFPGVPCVYYGDEAGMTGFEDPLNRGAFPWDGIDAELFSWYKRVIALRNAFAALRTGAFLPIRATEDVYVYARAIRRRTDVFGDPAENGFALVAVNRSPDRAEPIDIDLVNWNIPALFDPLAHTGSADAPVSPAAPVLPAATAAEFSRGRLTITLEPLGCRVLLYPAPSVRPGATNTAAISR